MIKTYDLSAGYGKKGVIDNISLSFKSGEVVVLIGPNGSGKSTVLKTLANLLSKVSGSVSFMDKSFDIMKGSEIARHVSVVTTDRIKGECMTCREVIASGRFPYTGLLGILSPEDESIVDEAVRTVHCEDICACDFSRISDGQRQRVLLARAVCQSTEVIILDEPTSYLDMYYKLDILKTVVRLAHEKGKLIIMSLHELDLVKAVADRVVCLDGDSIVKCGSTGEVFTGNFIQKLYGVRDDEFDPETGRMFLRL